MIILEGPDKTGKTSLAKALQRHLPQWELLHFGVPAMPVFEYHVKGIVASKWPELTIVDRLHWSEYAYGRVYRGRCGYDLKQWRDLETLLLQSKASVVLMMDKVDSIADRWHDEGFDPAYVRQLCTEFLSLAYGFSWPKSTIPCSVSDYDFFFNPDGSERDDRVIELAKSQAVEVFG